MNIEKLKQIVESVGCEMKQYCTGFFIMLPIKFPWYGKNSDEHECENSRIIAQVTNVRGSVKWLDTWTVPTINADESNGKALAIKMRKIGRCPMYMLQDFDSEELTAWLKKKIEEVSMKAKEASKMALTCRSKEYEA